MKRPLTFPSLIITVIVLYAHIVFGAEALTQLEASIFPLATSSNGSKDAPWIQEQLALIKKHLNLFDLLDVKISAATNLFYLPGNGIGAYMPFFDPSDRQLILGPIQNCSTGKETSFVAGSLHEFAHSIFTPNLYRSFALSDEPSSAESYNFVREILGEPSRELNKLVTIRDLTGPFDELFADLFAVIALDNPHAISDEISACIGSAVSRDFIENYQIANWSGGSLKPKNALTGANYHEVLSPLRPILWAAYIRLKLENISNPGGHVIQAFYNATIDLVREYWLSKITYQEWFAISKADLNQKLASRFQIALLNVIR